MVQSRLFDNRQACWAWNQVIIRDGTAPFLEQAYTGDVQLPLSGKVEG